jgi:integrase
MARQKRRIYWREGRAWGDFRDYADVGGKREALIVEGEHFATADEATAQVLVSDRLKELDDLRRGGALHGIKRRATLAEFADAHLTAKAKSAKFTDRWLENTERHLERAVEHFGATRALATITVEAVREWSERLLASGMSGGTVRHHLNALSNLYRRARAERVVPSGYDPVGDFDEKPSARREEAKWLEVYEAALFLEAARTYRPKRDDIAVPFAYPLLATFALTGGRRAEVLGLEVDDVSFDRQTVTFRPNDWRRLKTQTSHRVVRLWPQLEEVLRPYVFGPKPPGRLLFPCYRTGSEAMLTDFRKLLDGVAARAGWKPGELHSKMFRHTYTAARLQTLDGGAPVSVYTVAKELGHGGEAMVRRVYGHLGQVRHRAEVVEYRVEQHTEKLGERLAAMAR